MTWTMLAIGTLVFVRTSSFVAFLPPVSGKGIPATAKVVIACGLAVCWWKKYLLYGIANPTMFDSLPWFAICGIVEALIGAGLAWLAGSLTSLASTAGNVLADAMGLNMASVSSLLETGSGSSVAQLLETLFGMLLFALNIHHAFLLLLHFSFVMFPIGTLSLSVGSEQIMDWYVLLGTMPILAAMPLLAVSLGGISVICVTMRQSPQFNLLSYGMPLRLLLGLVALIVLLPMLLGRFGVVAEHFRDVILNQGGIGSS
ncbi:MAG: flagellar biosynthetic protein FliR [Planctomycetaceae bacterium]